LIPVIEVLAIEQRNPPCSGLAKRLVRVGEGTKPDHKQCGCDGYPTFHDHLLPMTIVSFDKGRLGFASGKLSQQWQ
jgi:hypothetical protein